MGNTDLDKEVKDDLYIVKDDLAPVLVILFFFFLTGLIELLRSWWAWVVRFITYGY